MSDIVFIVGILIIAGVAIGYRYLPKSGQGFISYNNKLFENNYEGIKMYLEEKLDRLDFEESLFKTKNKKQILKVNKKILSLTEQDQKTYQELWGWNQQVGKMIFISGILKEFYGGSKVKDRVWKKRGWVFSKDEKGTDYVKTKKSK